MCTVTYLPLSDGCILSSNRDESPLRAETPLTQEKIAQKMVSYPRDLKGGSWMFLSDSKEIICVLNGAFDNHVHMPPYDMSRGILAKRFFTYASPRLFFQKEDLAGIEPFTMIVIPDDQLFEFRWDGNVKYISQKASKQHHIWSSCTLYTPEQQKARSDWFFTNLDVTSEELVFAKFAHRNGTIDDPSADYVMNRNNKVRTVSITHVKITNTTGSIHYENLIAGKKEAIQIPFTHKN